MSVYKKMKSPIKAEFEDKEGNWIEFNYSSEATLKEAKLFYKDLDMEHIGSGYVTRVNGRKFIYPKLQHFFKYKENEQSKTTTH